MSLKSWLFPYREYLENELVAVKKERDDLLNRLIHAYSGYELRQPIPSLAEAQVNPAVSPQVDGVLGRGVMSTEQMMKEYENECLRQADGIADITVRAAREKVERENQEAAAEYERNIIKARQQAAAESGHTN